MTSLPDAPARVLLLHGMGCGPWVWRQVIDTLPPGLQPFAPVIAGHRGGMPLRAELGHRAPEQMLDDLERQLDELGIGRVHIVGNSLGGWLALKLSERGRALSVLCLAPAGGWRPGSLGDRLIISRFVLGHRMARQLARTPLLLRRARIRHSVLAPVVENPERVSETEALRFVRDLAECQALRSALGNADARHLDAVIRVGAPTTIAWSGKDRVLSGKWAREGFRHLRAEEFDVPNVGHLPMYDDPTLVAKLILESIESSARAESA